VCPLSHIVLEPLDFIARLAALVPHLNGHEVTVTASIGVTLYPLDSMDVDTLVKNSDTAMHRAKEAGRDTYRFYTPQMNTKAIEKLNVESALRRALSQDEFLLHYQPKVKLDTGRICGVEALLRWNRPGHGLIPPLDFIPILEKTGLIVPVGAWVIHAACGQLAEWRRAGLETPCIAINLSSRQFSREVAGAESGRPTRQHDIDPQLLELEIELNKALRTNNIDPTLIEFELTESLLMSHAEKSISILRRLKLLGIGLSIDDFGTGYSSLAYLKRLPCGTSAADQK
jgi:EAL domain-containing protein (putative c-di-GMP-specific phosphodiesterase class I)